MQTQIDGFMSKRTENRTIKENELLKVYQSLLIFSQLVSKDILIPVIKIFLSLKHFYNCHHVSMFNLESLYIQK